MSQKLRRVLLLVGVVDSGVLVPVMGLLPTDWVMAMGEGLVLKTREPLRCLGLSFASFTSGKGISSPEDTFQKGVGSKQKQLFTPTSTFKSSRPQSATNG